MIFKHCSPSLTPSMKIYDTYLFFSSSLVSGLTLVVESGFIKTGRPRDLLSSSPSTLLLTNPKLLSMVSSWPWLWRVLLGEEECSAGSRLWLAHRPRALLNSPPPYSLLLPWPNPCPLFICLICGKTHKHLCMICRKRLTGSVRAGGLVYVFVFVVQISHADYVF